MTKDKVKNKQITYTYEDFVGDSLYKEKLKNEMYHIMHQELDSSDVMDLDTDIIYNCVDVLDEIMAPSERIINPNIDAFIQNMLNERDRIIKERTIKQRVKMFKKVAGFLVIFIFSSIFVSQALDLNLWEKIIRLGDEAFELNLKNTSYSENQETGDGFESQIYESLDEVLDNLGVEAMVPQYFPEGYSLADITVTKLSTMTDVTVNYTNNDQLLMYTIQIFDSNSGDVGKTFEKDNKQFEIYQKDNVDYYIMNNLEQKQVVWSVSNQIYSLNGELSVEQMKEIINSLE